jgi:Protein kinase domain
VPRVSAQQKPCSSQLSTAERVTNPPRAKGLFEQLTGQADADAAFLAATRDDQLFRAVGRLMRDPYAPDGIHDQLHEASIELKRDPNVRTNTLGILGFVELIRSLTTAAELANTSANATSEATDLLRSSGVRTYFSKWYGIREKEIDLDLTEQLSVYKIGTTSFIVKCSDRVTGTTPRKHVALKCLLPRYIGNPSVTESAAKYPSEHEYFSEHAPAIFHANDRHVEMAFIKGDTLAEALAKLDAPPFSELRMEFARAFGDALISVLAAFHKDGIHHGDLSPSNIILRDGNERDPVLIDFGFNFVLQERVGSTVAFQRAAKYVAPEVLSGPSVIRRGDTPRLANDLYSLGLLLIEAFTGSRDSNFDRGGAIELLWEHAPGIAKLVEDLRDLVPEHRLVIVSRQDAADPYEDIRLALADEIALVNAFREFKAGTDEYDWKDIRQFLQIRQDQVRRLKLVRGKRIHKHQDLGTTYAEYPRLLKWARTSLWLWYVSLALFLLFTAADAGAANGQNLIDAYAHFMPIDIGDFGPNLLRRVAALSVALMGTAYYLKIYSMLTARQIGGTAAVEAERRLRAVAFLVALAELVPIVIYPRGWAICCALGGFIAVANNRATYRLAAQAGSTSIRPTDGEEGMQSDRFLETYQHWGPLMRTYALSLVGLQALLWAGIAHDEWIFALLVILMNLVKVYRINCIQDAPYIRANLDRRFFTLRRKAAISTGPQPVASASEPNAAVLSAT